MRIIDFLDRGALFYPEDVCLCEVDDNALRTFTFAQTVELSHRIAHALHRDGIRPGQPVAVLSPNDSLGYACMMGLFRAGGVWIPVNGRNPLAENQTVLATRGVTWLFYHSAYAAEAAALQSTIPTIRGSVCIDGAGEGEPSLDDWMSPEGCERVIVEERPEDLAAIVSTGGTTGAPKGAMLPHRVFETMAASYLTCMPTKGRPVHLVVAPMTHGAGATTFPMLVLGAKQIFMNKAEPAAILDAIERHRVTHVFMPPTLLYILLAHPQVRLHDHGSLRYLLLGAAPVAAEKLREAIDVFGPVVAQCFGQVEAPMMCTYLSPQELAEAVTSYPERLRSCGRPTPLTKVAIMADDGALLPAGQRGEIVIQGQLVMSGYHGDVEASTEVGKHGWHHTGDIGVTDEAGFLYIVDRKRDLIITGGFNVYPLEVEQVLLAHPAIQDAAVIGVPDEKWGEAIKAVVQAKPGQNLDIEEMMSWCRERLGGVKTPKTIEVWPDLPRSAVGKVLKKSIRQQFWAGQNRFA